MLMDLTFHLLSKMDDNKITINCLKILNEVLIYDSSDISALNPQ